MNNSLSPETRQASVEVIVRERLAMLAMLASPDQTSISRAVGLSSFVRFIGQNVTPDEMTQMSQEASHLLQPALPEEV